MGTQNPFRSNFEGVFFLILRLNAFYVYAIKSISRNYIYVGLTNNPKRRFLEHNFGA
ncbi:GIY-YIG nuclease family protein [Algoriphagus halophilus]|uniref:GIY-YIG nuclease family protein n=1 Tax=Algoriphagus halophilus TaxID=226505 RepID=UPI002936E2B9|nr:GIY-YIG nuclease family protein [Algoriphagus halophilus]